MTTEDALRMLVACFDAEGNLREQYTDQLSVALEKADEAIREAETDAELLERQRQVIVELKLELKELREQAVQALRKATGKAFRECEDLLAGA